MELAICPCGHASDSSQVRQVPSVVSARWLYCERRSGACGGRARSSLLRRSFGYASSVVAALARLGSRLDALATSHLADTTLAGRLRFAHRRVPCAPTMTVECPRCGTLYRRPARAEPGADTTYRCARCRHVFEAGADEPAMLSGDDEEHEFAFDDEPEDGDAAPDPVAVAFDIAAGEEGRPMKSPARFAMRTMLLVTVGFAVLSVYLYTHPEGVRTAFGGVPLIGSRLTEARLHPTAVQLTDVKGRYERVQSDRLVFVVSGTAVNNSAVPVRSIQVEGRIAGA